MKNLIKLKRKNNTFSGQLLLKNNQQGYPLANLQLGPDTKITLDGQRKKISTWLDMLYSDSPQTIKAVFNERSQLDWGHYLYQQLFADIEDKLVREADQVELCLLAEEEYIYRLPWLLLAKDGVFLSAAGWSIHFASKQNGTPAEDCVLPPAPKLLMVMPQPKKQPKTQAISHQEELQQLLDEIDPRYQSRQKLQIVKTWPDCCEALVHFQPDILYFYGHGEGNFSSSRLLFTEPNRAVKAVPVMDMAQQIRQLATPPKLAYINCCFGDSGGVLGVGQQLGGLIPAVVSNRSLAWVTAARQQALAFFRNLLLHGLCPHLALQAIHHSLSSTISYKDIRWMTPVLYRHYQAFETNPPSTLHDEITDPHWRLKVDRINQFGRIFYQTSQMLQEKKPRSLAYLWYGQEGQGVELFQQRLEVELKEKLPALLYTVQPQWPDLTLPKNAACFQEMLAQAFEVDFSQIAGKIRALAQGTKDKPILVYVRHEVVRSSTLVTPAFLKTYLQWWDCEFISHLPTHCYALLGLSFIVQKPEKFYNILREKYQIEQLPLQDTLFDMLDEMEKLKKKDLSDFIKSHNIRLPPGKEEQCINIILDKTEGQYEQTLDELQNIVTLAIALIEQEAQNEAVEDDDDCGY